MADNVGTLPARCHDNVGTLPARSSVAMADNVGTLPARSSVASAGWAGLGLGWAPTTPWPCCNAPCVACTGTHSAPLYCVVDALRLGVTPHASHPCAPLSAPCPTTAMRVRVRVRVRVRGGGVV